MSCSLHQGNREKGNTSLSPSTFIFKDFSHLFCYIMLTISLIPREERDRSFLFQNTNSFRAIAETERETAARESDTPGAGAACA